LQLLKPRIFCGVVLQVSLDVAVTVDEFFEEDTFVRNMAFVLMIDPARIRVVSIIRGRRSTDTASLELEIGVPSFHTLCSF
jgi:hypothetical protein